MLQNTASKIYSGSFFAQKVCMRRRENDQHIERHALSVHGIGPLHAHQHAIYTRSMRSMRSMRGGIIFRNRGPSLKVHHGQCPTRIAKHDSGGSPPGAACDSAKPPHGKTQGSTSGWSHLCHQHAIYTRSHLCRCATHVHSMGLSRFSRSQE
jgi:hypothetical protein